MRARDRAWWSWTPTIALAACVALAAPDSTARAQDEEASADPGDRTPALVAGRRYVVTLSDFFEGTLPGRVELVARGGPLDRLRARLRA
ncbi:MAG: hypothetical protein M3Y87_13060, partial [Myxococcota bacterium]|nr:hypothetical protein [Myxococcota bacterium]